MRKWLVIAAASLLLVVGVAVFWLRPEPSRPVRASTTGAPSARALPEFQAVEFPPERPRGWALTGRVLDPAGHPVAGAEVFLAASAAEDAHRRAL